MVRTAILVLVLALFALPVAAGEISGKASAIDGDTLKVGDATVHLFGIDAPELRQTCTSRRDKLKQCGVLARQMLDTLVKNVSIKCKGETGNKDGAVVAVCFAGPFDINEQMVASGWAFALREETEVYVRAETFAKARKEGLWRGAFIMPWQWRKENGVE